MTHLTAEEFLREKLASEIESFGDGMTEFHTRDIQHLLHCLDNKDEQIEHSMQQCAELVGKVNFGAEVQFDELLELVMSISNASAEERLCYIRQKYKPIYEKRKKK